MHLSCTRHLGGTVTAGHPLAGTRYASHTQRKPHSTCWMELAIFDHLPVVPSLAGTLVQERNDLLASTKGAGSTVTKNIILQFELFDDEAPKACANFLRLCCGRTTCRQGQTYCFQGLTPSYRGTFFHKIIPRLCAQGGDITMRVDGGANHLTSAGRGWFADESKKRRHNEAGLLSMANNGPDSNGAQFFITTADDQERALNGRHVCFGRVTEGLQDFLREVAPYGSVQGYPSRYVVVVDCGEGAALSADFDDSVGASHEVATCEDEVSSLNDVQVAASSLTTSGNGDGAVPVTAAQGSADVAPAAEAVTEASAAADGKTGQATKVEAAVSSSKPGLMLPKSHMKAPGSAKSYKHVTYAEGV